MPAPKTTLYLRLTRANNAAMRRKARYHGDLSRFVDQSLDETDLSTVPLSAAVPAREHQLIASVRPEMDRKLRRAAAKRGCDIVQLANSALEDWLPRNNPR